MTSREPKPQAPTGAPIIVLFPTQRPLRNHPAFKHLVGDGSCHSVEKQRAHLRIGPQKLNCLLFLRRRWLFVLSLRPQLLAGGGLVFLNDLVGNLVQYRVLILSPGSTR